MLYRFCKKGAGILEEYTTGDYYEIGYSVGYNDGINLCKKIIEKFDIDKKDEIIKEIERAK